MKKTITLFAFFFGMKGGAQNYFIPYLEVFKVTNGPVPLRDVWMDSKNFGLYGTMDSIFVYDTSQNSKVSTKVFNLDGATKKVATQWVNAGNVGLPNGYVVLRHLITRDGAEYITTEFSPYVRQMNSGTNFYDPIESLDFNGPPEIIQEWGEHKIIYAQNFGSVNGSIVRGCVIWDRNNHQLTIPTGPSQIGIPHYVMKDSSLIAFDYSTMKLFVLHYGETVWEEVISNPLPTNYDVIEISAEEINDVFSLTYSSRNNYLDVWRSKNQLLWEKIMTIHTTGLPDLWVYEGNLFISGSNIDECNEAPSNGLIVWNEQQGARDLVTTLPVSPQNIAGLWNIGQKMYMTTYGGVGDLLKSHTVFVLKDNSVLPVEIKNFKGEKVDMTVKLSWDVSQETNVRYYEIFRSSDNRTYCSIGKVIATNKSGYSFVDNDPLSGKGYYLLKEVDNDGKNQYTTNVVLIDINALLKIYPNPVASTVYVQGVNIGETISIISTNGIVLKKMNTQSDPYNIDVSNLSSGIYFLITESGSKIKFLKL